jgi:hypothetical protein
MSDYDMDEAIEWITNYRKQLNRYQIRTAGRSEPNHITHEEIYRYEEMKKSERLMEELSKMNSTLERLIDVIKISNPIPLYNSHQSHEP